MVEAVGGPKNKYPPQVYLPIRYLSFSVNPSLLGYIASDLEAVTQRRSRVKAAGEPEKLGTKAALGRDRQK